MVKLEDLLSIIWNVTLLHISAYSDDLRLYHTYMIGQKIELSVYQWHDVEKGELTAIERQINDHGTVNKRGLAESGWGINIKKIPQEMLESEVWHMSLMPRGSSTGTELIVSVRMPYMAVQMLKDELQQDPGILKQEFEIDEDGLNTKGE